MSDPIDDDFDPSSATPEQPKPTPLLPDDQLAKLLAMKEKASNAFKSGTSDAREAFEKKFPKAREDIEKGINDLSYAIGYAISFGSTLAREFSPDNVTDGFDRGSRAGARAAEEVVRHRKNNPTNENDPTAS